ncbi:hypothetical protein [Armatimonas rosea]|uniref:Uncharacterized protein n=1 Tax=Armatimonas rosea TaxID=685828 RepID=A0A7W9SM54_ARMRO|nr:hypothetical protein [Armatimonas rosea]MBB6048714.1 hypothetical protein [Armatimonas rosea]
MTRAEYFRFRTHASGLTDDELIHFDWFARAAMDGSWSYWVPADEAALHMNLPFQPHTMTDAELIARIDRWEAAGLFQRNDEDPSCFMLTPVGGALWAAERLPVWERYYRVDFYSGAQRFMVTAPDQEIARKQLRSAIARGYIRSHKRPKTYRLRRWPDEDFPWPRFKQAWQRQIRVKHGMDTFPDWERLETDRVGWSRPVELIALRLSEKLPWPEPRL